eukprot:1086109-Prymnesium_polylepis.1
MRIGRFDQRLKGYAGSGRWAEAVHLVLGRKPAGAEKGGSRRAGTSTSYQVLRRRGAVGSTLSGPAASTAQTTCGNALVGAAYKSIA